MQTGVSFEIIRKTRNRLERIRANVPIPRFLILAPLSYVPVRAVRELGGPTVSNIAFGLNDATTQDLKGHQGVNEARALALDAAKMLHPDGVGPCQPPSITMPPHLWLYGVDQFNASMRQGDVVAWFLGSYTTNVTVSCGCDEAGVKHLYLTFQVNNTSGWASATRFRKGKKPGEHLGILPDRRRGWGGIQLGGNLGQTWAWTESIP